MRKHLLASLALFLSACTGTGQDGRGYPSLARRPAESTRVGGESPAVDHGQAVVLAPADPLLAQQIAALSAQADQGKGAFEALYVQVAGTIRMASGAPVSSESWVAAHVDLSRLEEARYDSIFALASLDTLYADRMKALAEGKAQGGITEILAAHKVALATVDAQNDRVDALKALLKEP